MKRLFIFLSAIIGICHISYAQADGESYYGGTDSSYENRDWGASISALVGFTNPTADMKDYFDALASAQFDLAGRYKKAFAGLRFGVNGGWNNKVLSRKDGSEYWPRDHHMRLSTISLFGGYTICDFKYFRISPYISCGINEVKGVGDFDDDEYEIDDSDSSSSTFTWGPGCAFDIKLLKLSARIGESIAIRFNYQYNVCNYDRKYVRAEGDLQSYTVGLNLTF